MRKFDLLYPVLLSFCFIACNQTPHTLDSVIKSANLELTKKVIQSISDYVENEDEAKDLKLLFQEPERQKPVFLSLRNNGQKHIQLWAVDDHWAEGLTDLLDKSLRSLQTRDIRDFSMILSLPHTNPDGSSRKGLVLNNVYRGILALEFSAERKLAKHSPNEIISTNLSHEKALEQFLQMNQLQRMDVKVNGFDCHELYIDFEEGISIKSIFRGNQIINPDSLDYDQVVRAADLMGEWMINAVHDNGRLVYKYWPSSGKESTANNMIRQFMGSICLNRWIEFKNLDEQHKLTHSNLDYNFAKFYRRDGSLGYVEYSNKVKLGAVALAALSILENRNANDYSNYELSFRELIQSLWKENGKFNTWYKPNNRDDNHNFYPGEALLYWSFIYLKENDQSLLKQIMKSFEYYREWHRNNRNPAFIPWHTQAYYNVWTRTKDSELKDFIYEMNDFIVDFQQWESVQFKDVMGRFYDPKRRNYGPPHASSTGVYLEGLIDAYKLAKEIGDEQRAEKYRNSICKGLRSVLQLQFDDDLDMFYISQKKKVRGGIRTTVYNNEIRVDNVQHILMGVMKILETFEPADFYIK